jgi:hypothetical protein
MSNRIPREGVTYEPDCWVKGLKATNFGCGDGYACKYFSGSNSKGDCNNTAMGKALKVSTPIETDCKLFLVGIPKEIQTYFFPETGVNWKSVPSVISHYQKIAGTPLEVVNLNNGSCTVVPLWETGPGKNENGKIGGSIDLTKPVKLLLGGNGSNFPVRYRPVQTGKKGCEGYKFMDPNGKGFNIPQRKGLAPALTS